MLHSPFDYEKCYLRTSGIHTSSSGMSNCSEVPSRSGSSDCLCCSSALVPDNSKFVCVCVGGGGGGSCLSYR